MILRLARNFNVPDGTSPNPSFVRRGAEQRLADVNQSGSVLR
jgi:hypothetical protein